MKKSVEKNMESKSVFGFKSYKALMAHWLTGEGRRGQLTKAAKAIHCQRSYLSRVISEGLHLTQDHAYNLSKFLNLSASEREYFLILVDLERAGTVEYRKFLEAKLLDLKKKNESIQVRTQRSALSIESHMASYFSNWLWTAIHFLTSIPKYQHLENLSEHVGLKKETLLHYLKILEEQGYVAQNAKGLWQYKSGEFHVPKESPLVLMHHQNWRSRALVEAQNFNQDNLHFTGVWTMSHEDRSKIKELLLNLLSEVSEISGPSQPEEAAALTIDFFKI